MLLEIDLYLLFGKFACFGLIVLVDTVHVQQLCGMIVPDTLTIVSHAYDMIIIKVFCSMQDFKY